MSKCAECVYWNPHWEGAAMGDCRRRVPLVLLYREEITTVFPETGESEWCGEFVAKNAECQQGP